MSKVTEKAVDEKAVDERAVRALLDSEEISTFFQPVVSVPTNSVIGFEAFSRGCDSEGEDIPPCTLFDCGLSQDIRAEVDKLCKRRAFEKFKPIYDAHPHLLLFVNTDDGALMAVEPDKLPEPALAAKVGIKPENIVLQGPMRALARAQTVQQVSVAKKAGFRICLQKCSLKDPYHLAISRARPDFLKIDESFYHAGKSRMRTAPELEIFVEVAGRYGASVIAPLIEDEEDSLRLLSGGVFLQQGYYYTRDETSGELGNGLNERINRTYSMYNRVGREVIRRKKERLDATYKRLSSVCNRLSSMDEDGFEEGCRALVGRNPKSVDIISIFILNKVGVQAIPHVHMKPESVLLGSSAALGSGKGVNHAMRNFFLYLDMGYDKYMTSPFPSPFTGEKACIVSKRFFSYDGAPYTVCIEVPYPG